MRCSSSSSSSGSSHPAGCPAKGGALTACPWTRGGPPAAAQGPTPQSTAASPQLKASLPFRSGGNVLLLPRILPPPR